jgi:hypothetical protein
MWRKPIKKVKIEAALKPKISHSIKTLSLTIIYYIINVYDDVEKPCGLFDCHFHKSRPLKFFVVHIFFAKYILFIILF